VVAGESNPLRTVVILGIGAFLVSVVFILWRYGAKGFVVVMKQLLIFTLVLAVLFGIIYGVVWFYIRRQVDMVQVHKERIIDTCRISKHPYSQTIALKAHMNDFEVRELGKVIGTCAIQAEPQKTEFVDKDGNVKYKHLQNRWRQMFFVAFKPPGFINFLTGSKEVVAGVREDFGVFSSSVIYMNGMTLAPKVHGLFFLWHHWQDTILIDDTIRKNIYRLTMTEMLKDEAALMEDAVDISPKHVKEKERRNVQDVPIQAAQPPPSR
jgi:hypothetical protein